MKPNFNHNYRGIKCRVCLVRDGAYDEVIKISEPSDAYELVKDELVNSDREMFLSIMLTVKNALIGVETVCVGSVVAITVTPRDVFKSAILANAVAIIVCHNHPSGELTPSINDLEVTKELVNAGELLGIKVLDHLIVSSQGYKCLREYNELPK
ncbi:JAB domain-containing protein [Thermodesulfobacteriota bacterium]